MAAGSGEPEVNMGPAMSIKGRWMPGQLDKKAAWRASLSLQSSKSINSQIYFPIVPQFFYLYSSFRTVAAPFFNTEDGDEKQGFVIYSSAED